MASIAIIGGGPAAISICIQLTRLLQQITLSQPIEIIVFEKANSVGQGTPYASEESSHLVNLSKDMMDLSSDERMQFSDWLALTLQSDCLNSSFPPRYYFGQYVNSRAMAVQQIARPLGLAIEYLTQCEVLGISVCELEQYDIATSQGRYKVDYVVLSTGHLPSSNFTHLIGTPGYVHQPWSNPWDFELAPAQAVGILGSRLTAIDVALKLKATAHQGKIYLFSRSGQLPAVRGKESWYRPKYLTIENVLSITKNWVEPLKLIDLLGLFWQEINTIGHTKQGFIRFTTQREWMTYEINQAENAPRDLQKVLSIGYQLISKLWSKLSLRDQMIFYKKYYPLFTIYTCSFPLENAYQIKSMLDSQELEIYSGLVDVSYQHKHFTVHFKQQPPIKTKYLINATGAGHNPEYSPLLQQMLQDNLLIKHTLGGIRVKTESLNTVDGYGKVNPRMYALGDLVRGSCFCAIEINHVVQQANKISRHLIQSICAKQPIL